MERFDISNLKPNEGIHFIGIGGISMSGLAMIAVTLGFSVSGSDWNKSHITEKLTKLGADIVYGKGAVNEDGIRRAALVVYTAAAKADNPEMILAHKLNKRTIDRAEFLGAIMKMYKNAINVAGTHGKTTTTSMLAHAFTELCLDPTISIGGELDLIGGNIKTGGSEYFITEACEYTNSFLKFFPTVSLITNIEADHLDFFSGLDDIIKSFKAFAELTTGKVVAMWDDKNVRKALSDADADIVKYGMEADCDYYPENLVYSAGYPQFYVCKNGETLCHIDLNVPGVHNVLNALATVAVCDVLGLDVKTAATGIEKFKGTHRRFEKKGYINGATVIDDYAHHPTEIAATLKAAAAFGHERIRCIFQPHTYSRTRTLWDDFVRAFDGCDELILTHIYPAREAFDGVTRPENLAEDIKKRGVNARYIDEFSDIAKYIKETARKGDIIFTMGAGDVTDIGQMILG